MNIDYELVLNTIGWASCKVAIASSSATITASYLGHALEELVEAACLIMSGEQRARRRISGKNQGSIGGLSIGQEKVAEFA